MAVPRAAPALPTSKSLPGSPPLSPPAGSSCGEWTVCQPAACSPGCISHKEAEALLGA